MRNEIIQNNYIFLPGFISSEEAFLLAEDFKNYLSKFNERDETDPAQHVGSGLNWLPFIKLLVRKIPFISDALGENVLPTYTYARLQTTGHDLPSHRDRDACEISLSLNLKKDKDWGLWIEKPNKEFVEINLNPGDAVMYLGCQASHWRNKFEGTEHIQAFFHYVRENGPKAWAFFDKKQQQIPTLKTHDLPVSIL